MITKTHQTTGFLAKISLLIGCLMPFSLITLRQAQADEAEKSTAKEEAIYTVNSLNSDVLFSILPFYEDVSGMKIVVSNKISPALTMTIDSPDQMNREQMIAFHHQRFAEYGYEIIPINETTVQFASMKDQKPKPAQAEPAPARRVILPPRNIVTPPKDDQQEEGPFTIVCLQAPLRHEILPLYEELVKKKIIIDPTIDETITMTIFSSKKMDRAEAINFCEESFKASGYEIVPADKTSLKFQPIKSKDPEK